MGSFVSFPCSLPELWSSNCLKSAFFQFCVDLSNKSKFVQAIYIYASERSRYTFSENGIVYYAMTYSSGGIRVWTRRILLNVCWVSNFFDILIANISLTEAQTPINHIILWKSVMATFRCIYVISFETLRFLAEICTKLQKNSLFWQSVWP